MHAPLYTVGAAGYDDIFARATRLFMPALLRAAQLQSGHNVLDVATGTGEAAVAASTIVGAAGSVTAGDISPAMLDIARAKLRGARITLDIIDGHSLPYADQRFDTVLCQLGLMLFADPARALTEFRRVLRPGGRVAVTVSTTPERTLFLRVAAVIARHVPDRAAAIRQHFGILNEQSLRGLFVGAGLRDVRVESECRDFSFESFDAYFSGIEAGATLGGQEYVRLPPDLQRAVRRDVQQELTSDPDGPLSVPMEVLIGSGRR
jgi:ubiquinone/menaquinone biosynthesis C-methylase UbiE